MSSTSKDAKSENISVRLPRQTKEQMSELGGVIDWPVFIRQAIEAKIREIRRQSAVTSMDAVRRKTEKDEFNSVESVREDRTRA